MALLVLAAQLAAWTAACPPARASDGAAAAHHGSVQRPHHDSEAGDAQQALVLRAACPCGCGERSATAGAPAPALLPARPLIASAVAISAPAAKHPEPRSAHGRAIEHVPIRFLG